MEENGCEVHEDVKCMDGELLGCRCCASCGLLALAPPEKMKKIGSSRQSEARSQN